MRRIISFTLCLATIFLCAIPGFASELSCLVEAKVAVVTNVAENGSNLTDDYHLNENTTVYDVVLDITCLPSNLLEINANFDDISFAISSTPAAKSENQQAIFYNTTSSSQIYEVVHMEYVNDGKTNMFFKQYMETNKCESILKIYIRDLSSNTRDYIIIECFDYILPNFDSIVSNLQENALLAAWVTEEFTPALSDTFDASTFAYTSNTVRTYTVYYNEFVQVQVHTITIATDCTYSNIIVGQNADICYRLEVVGKSMHCDGNPLIDSDTTSFLHVDSATLTQATVPNVAFTSTSIDGRVQNNSYSGSLLSADLSYSFGPLSISLALPTSFSNSLIIDINDLYESYVNGRNGQWTRSIKTSMKSDYKLTQIGHYFEVNSTITDFGNVTQSVASHQGVWSISIINAADYTSQQKTIYQYVNMSIV